MGEIKVIEEVGRVPRNALSEFRARVLRVRGTRCADLRIFTRNPQGELVATKSGLCFATAKIGAVRALVEKLAAACGPDDAAMLDALEEANEDTTHEQDDAGDGAPATGKGSEEVTE